jgi:hypothetical protein
MPDHSEPNKDTLSAIASLRGMEFSSPEDLATYLKDRNAKFPWNYSKRIGPMLVTRIKNGSGGLSVPDWLSETFSEIIGNAEIGVICDPYPGIGLLLGALIESSNARKSIAISYYPGQTQLGEVIVPQIEWIQKNPVHHLLESTSELDVVASILPMGMSTKKTIRVSLPSGESRQLDDDFGTQVLITSAMRLGQLGRGLYVVTPNALLSSSSALQKMGDFGLGIEAALYLPSGTFAPHTNMAAYLIIVSRKIAPPLFVAQLSSDHNTNRQVIENYRLGREGGPIELGRLVTIESFNGIDRLRFAESMRAAEKNFGYPAVQLVDIVDVKTEVVKSDHRDEFAFPPANNAVYIPLTGTNDVVETPDDLPLKSQCYIQVAIDPLRSTPKYVSMFYNSDFGRWIREHAKSGFITVNHIKRLPIFVPSIQIQSDILDLDKRISVEQNTVMALHNDISELRRDLWASPKCSLRVRNGIDRITVRLASNAGQHASDSLESWLEKLPFPQASILRAWQATSSQDYKTKYEHLLHFFEGTAEFFGIILLSAFSSNDALFSLHRDKIKEAMKNQNLSFSRATFGTWKLVVEYLGKQTRILLKKEGKKPDVASQDRDLCANIFSDESLLLPEALSRTSLSDILSTANSMRNNWSGHGGVVGNDESESRNQLLLAEVQKLRNSIADTWSEMQLIRSNQCRPKRGSFENEVSVLMGSNNEFLKETRVMSTWMDVDSLYLSRKDGGGSLRLLPLIQVGPSPQSAKNACYFFNRLDRDGARFVSYHFTDKPELHGQFADTSAAIKLLSGMQSS